MEERRGRHHTVPLEHHTVLHYEPDLAESVDVLQGIALDRDEVRDETNSNGTARVCGLADQVSVRRHGPQDVDRRDVRGFPRFDELDRDFPARHPWDPVVCVGRESQRDAVLVGVAQTRNRSLEPLRARMSGQRQWRLSAGAKDSLLRHRPVHLVGEAAVVRDGPDARLDRAARAIDRLHVTLDFESCLGGLSDKEPDLVDAIPPRLAVHTDLDHPRTEQRVLSDRFHDLVRRVRLEILGVHDVVIERHLRRRPELSAHPPDDDAGVDDRRSRNPALLDGLT